MKIAGQYIMMTEDDYMEAVQAATDRMRACEDLDTFRTAFTEVLNLQGEAFENGCYDGDVNNLEEAREALYQLADKLEDRLLDTKG